MTATRNGITGAYSVDSAALAEGTYTAQASQSDTAGNTGSSSANTFVVDTTAPDSTILTTPANPTNSTSATFTFNATDPPSGGVASGVNHTECQLDGGLWVTCTSPQNYTGLAEGSHTFKVRAVDNAANVESTPASYTWVIDTTGPNVAITHPANGGAYSEASWDAGCSTIAGDFCGTAGDGGSGLGLVQVSVYRDSTNRWWDWTTLSFTATTEQMSTVTVTAGLWKKAFSFANFPTTGSYTIHARATDLASNLTDAYSVFTINRYTLYYNNPIDGSTPTSIVINNGKNGRVIPVKVNVYLEGVNQSSAQVAEGLLTINVNPITCGSSVVVDDVELYADAGQSNGNTSMFRANGDSWIYNLDTKALGLTTNQCYRLDVYLKSSPSATAVRISTQQFAVFKPIK